MLELLALVISLLAFGFSFKAYLDSRWIEIDWHLNDDDESV